MFIYLFIYFWPHSAAYRILVTQPGIEPVPPALGAQSLNHWTTREVPGFYIKHNLPLPKISGFLMSVKMKSLEHRYNQRKSDMYIMDLELILIYIMLYMLLIYVFRFMGFSLSV